MKLLNKIKSFFFDKTIVFKLTVLFTLSIFIIYSLIYLYIYKTTAKFQFESIKNNTEYMGESIIYKIDNYLESIETSAQTLANFVKTFNYDEVSIKNITQVVVKSNPALYGSVIAFEPYKFSKSVKHIAHYYYKQNDEILYSDLGTDEYNYPETEWFSKPKAESGAIWSEPYYDDGGGDILMTTYSYPIYRNHNDFIGIATADLSLEDIKEFTSKINIYDNGYIFIISKEGRFITHPDASIVMNETISSISKKEKNYLVTAYSNLISVNKSGFQTITDAANRNKSFLYFAPVETTSWILGIIIPYDEAMAAINIFNKQLLLWGIAGLIIIGIVIFWTAKKIARPIRFLTESSELIALGKLDEAAKKIDYYNFNIVDLHSNKNEIVRLILANVNMINNLKSLVLKVSNSSGIVSNVSNKISNSINIFETSIDNQNNASHQISNVADEVTTGITEIAGAMNRITGASETVSIFLTEGKTNLDYINETMKNLMNSAKDINEKLNLISNNTSNITNVITAITKVVNQTNLLSLNAAIEAEKAGEYGAGFSVVAKEIRQLADQTAVAALDIESMIDSMKTVVEDGVKTVEQYTAQTVNGYDKIVKTGEGLAKMINQTKNITDEIAKINDKIQLHKEHSTKINDSVDVINMTVENNRNHILEFVKISASLNNSVKDLQNEIKKHF